MAPGLIDLSLSLSLTLLVSVLCLWSLLDTAVLSFVLWSLEEIYTWAKQLIMQILLKKIDMGIMCKCKCTAAL